jgi:hypothetical protein
MPPINLHAEHLMPLRNLPDYLVMRGLGKRVSMRTVKRWITMGCHGVRLEAVVIDRITLTSVEAVQRWADRQTAAANGLTTAPRPNPTPPEPASVPPTAEHLASIHLLTEHRVMPTDLDRLINALDHPESMKVFAAGLLFRAGLRTRDDALRAGLRGLLAVKGMGKRSEQVVHSLWASIGS